MRTLLTFTLLAVGAWAQPQGTVNGRFIDSKAFRDQHQQAEVTWRLEIAGLSNART